MVSMRRNARGDAITDGDRFSAKIVAWIVTCVQRFWYVESEELLFWKGSSFEGRLFVKDIRGVEDVVDIRGVEGVVDKHERMKRARIERFEPDRVISGD
jgi:hypothetical protein